MSDNDRFHTAVLDEIWELFPDQKTYDCKGFEELITKVFPAADAEACARVIAIVRKKLGQDNRGSYFYGSGISRPERDERLRELARIVANAIATVRPSIVSSGRSRFELCFSGPFGLVTGSGLPLAQDQPVARHQGIYLWTIEVGGAYAINYVGKTGGQSSRCFGVRFEEELVYERGDGAKCWDLAALARAQRKRIHPKTSAEQADNVEAVLAMYKLFMAPVAASKPTLLEIEARVIACLQCDPKCCTFLANGGAHPKGLPIDLSVTSGVRLIGLESLR